VTARSRPLAVVAVLAGALVVVAASGRTWASVTVGVAGGSRQVGADGTLVAPGAVAVALVAAAGAVVLATSGRAVRRVVATLLVAAGLGVAALSVPVWGSPARAAEPAVARVSGTVGSAARDARVTAWPAVSAAGGVLVVLGGAVALLLGTRWAGPSRRFDRPTVPAASGPGVPPPAASGVPPAVDAGRDRDRRLDAWDSLSRGEDPTAGP